MGVNILNQSFLKKIVNAAHSSMEGGDDSFLFCALVFSYIPQ